MIHRTTEEARRRRTRRLFPPVFVATFIIASLAIHGATYPPDVSLTTISQRIEAISTDHPRLFMTQAELDDLRASLPSDPFKRRLAGVIVRQADQLLDQDPIERRLQGRRLLGQSRRCIKRTMTLAMAFQLTDDVKYARRCETEMLAVAAFSDWNPSHFLDVAEMTFAMAIGYDWLYHQLPESSRAKIRQAILDKGVRLPFETRHKGWVRSRNNWGQVCHGGLTAGALALLEDEPEWAAKTVHNALQNVRYSMAAYAPNGSYPEGPGYWSYGTTYNVLLIALIEGAFGTDFDLSKAPGFDQTGQYLAMVTGPSGLSFNYADGGSGRSPEPALMWFANKFQRPDWLLGEAERWTMEMDRLEDGRSPESGGRFMPLALAWHNAFRSTEIRMPLHWRSDGETPITVHRSSWTDADATFLGVKAGSPSAYHGQMDTGSFVLDADGVRWALDLGAEGYHGIESRGMNLWDRSQNSDRWKIFRQRNEGHNTLVIDGQLQLAAGHGKIVSFKNEGRMPHTIVDLEPVYRGQAKSVRRGFALLRDGAVLIQDELIGLKPGSVVRWGMITPGNTIKKSGRTIELGQGNARLTLKNLSPRQTQWQAIDTETPSQEWDSPNRGTQMVALEATTPGSGKLTIAVLAIPRGPEASVTEDFELRPLDRW